MIFTPNERTLLGPTENKAMTTIFYYSEELQPNF